MSDVIGRTTAHDSLRHTAKPLGPDTACWCQVCGGQSRAHRAASLARIPQTTVAQRVTGERTA